MLNAATIARIPDWITRKDAQWQRISDNATLALVTNGFARTTYRLSCHHDDFYESTIIGRLPQEQIEAVIIAGRRTPRIVPDVRKDVDLLEIDLSDDQIDQIVSAWSEKTSAYSLSFVRVVWDGNGGTRTKGRNE